MHNKEKSIFLTIVLLLGAWSGGTLGEEETLSQKRARVFDDTPVKVNTPTPTPTPGYNTFHNQGLGKMEMLEEVDKHLEKMTKTLAQLTERIVKIEDTLKKIPEDLDQIKNTELPAIKKQLSATTTGAPSGNLLEGIGEGELKDMKTKVEEIYGTSLPNLQFEVSIMKDNLRTLESMVGTMETIKSKGPGGGVSIELDKDTKKAP